jgi:hypothetical protein
LPILRAGGQVRQNATVLGVPPQLSRGRHAMLLRG